MKKNGSTSGKLFPVWAIAVLFSLSALVTPICRGQGNNYLINKGDQLLVTVWGYSEFTTTQTVKDNGFFPMPLIGDVKAAGLTKEAFISSLKEKLAEYIQGEIRITVSILASIGQRVTILGAVVRPDNYPISGDVNLFELISMAGGYLPDARLTKVKIFYKDKLQPAAEIDLDSYLEKSDLENIPKVHPGDMVYVPRQENAVEQFGEFFRDVALLFTLFRLTGN